MATLDGLVKAAHRMDGAASQRPESEPRDTPDPGGP